MEVWTLWVLISRSFGSGCLSVACRTPWRVPHCLHEEQHRNWEQHCWSQLCQKPNPKMICLNSPGHCTLTNLLSHVWTTISHCTSPPQYRVLHETSHRGKESKTHPGGRNTVWCNHTLKSTILLISLCLFMLVLIILTLPVHKYLLKVLLYFLYYLVRFYVHFGCFYCLLTAILPTYNSYLLLFIPT